MHESIRSFRRKAGVFAVGLALLPAAASGQSSQPPPTGDQRFGAFAWLAGEWQGYGQMGERVTYIHKAFGYDVGGRDLVERTLDMFPPSKPSTEFELHQDFIVYFRTDAGSYRAKGFFVEGFVWNSTVTVTPERLVIETESVENAPAGMRARLTYTKDGASGFKGTFELAMPGQDYKLFETLVMRRVS